MERRVVWGVMMYHLFATVPGVSIGENQNPVGGDPYEHVHFLLVKLVEACSVFVFLLTRETFDSSATRS